MQSKIINTEVFIAEDGKEFLKAEDCQNYEKNVLERKKNISYFRISHSADFTEGRGFQSFSLVAVEAQYSRELVAEMFCQIVFGNRVQWMYHSPAEAWNLTKITEKDYFENKPHKYGKKLFLSHSEMESFPKPIQVSDKLKKDDIMI